MRVVAQYCALCLNCINGLYLRKVMNDNEFETKKNILIETQNTHCTPCTGIVWYVFYIVETQRHWIKRFLYYNEAFKNKSLPSCVKHWPI